MIIQCNYLKLVCAPFSNQEGVWLSADTDFQQAVARSKLYMLGQRSELTFENIRFDDEALTLSLKILRQDTHSCASVTIPLSAVLGDYIGDVDLEMGPKLIRFYAEPRNTSVEPIQWFTPDRLLFGIMNGHLPAKGVPDLRNFWEFSLLYVGISKRGDSVSRLSQSGHEGRLSILSSQHPRVSTSRVTDEVTCFLFDIDVLGVRNLDGQTVASEGDSPFIADQASLAADAEKALVHVLRPPYNEVVYAAYPRGRDSLFHSGLSVYSYSLQENLTFSTDNNILRGDLAHDMSDAIVVTGSEVVLQKYDVGA